MISKFVCHHLIDLCKVWMILSLSIIPTKIFIYLSSSLMYDGCACCAVHCTALADVQFKLNIKHQNLSRLKNVSISSRTFCTGFVSASIPVSWSRVTSQMKRWDFYIKRGPAAVKDLSLRLVQVLGTSHAATSESRSCRWSVVVMSWQLSISLLSQVV